MLGGVIICVLCLRESVGASLSMMTCRAIRKQIRALTGTTAQGDKHQHGVFPQTDTF